MTFSTSCKSALLSHKSLVSLISSGFLIRRRDHLPVDGMSYILKIVKKQVSAIQPIEHYVRLTREKCTSMVSSSLIRRECVLCEMDSDHV